MCFQTARVCIIVQCESYTVLHMFVTNLHNYIIIILQSKYKNAVHKYLASMAYINLTEIV